VPYLCHNIRIKTLDQLYDLTLQTKPKFEVDHLRWKNKGFDSHESLPPMNYQASTAAGEIRRHDNA